MYIKEHGINKMNEIVVQKTIKKHIRFVTIELPKLNQKNINLENVIQTNMKL